MSLYLLLDVFCDDEFLDPCPNYAVVEVNEAVVDLMLADIQRVRDLKEKTEDSLYLMGYWDFRPRWACNLDEWADHHPAVDLLTGTDVLEAVADNSFALLADKPEVDEDDPDNRTEGCTQVATVDGIRWQAIPKHTNASVETATIRQEDWERIKSILQRKPGRFKPK